MTLYEYLQSYTDDELTVWDADYDMETYFYKDTSNDEWDKAMVELSKLLTVTSTSAGGVNVNLSQLIESKLDKLGDLFYVCEIDEIMDDIDNIMAGGVSEEWFVKFVKALQ